MNFRNKVGSKIDFNKMKLAHKIAMYILAILIFIFVSFIVFTGFYTKSILSQVIQAELTGVAKNNAKEVQNVLDTVNASALELQDYFTKILSSRDEDTKQQVEELHPSKIYNQLIDEEAYLAEEFLYNNAMSTIKNNKDIFGMGVFFEPYKFDENLQSYAFYISEATIGNEKIEPYGTYNTYSKEVYYSKVKELQTAYFTEPYNAEGVTMISATYPIMDQGEFIGSIASDINISNFNRIDVVNERYPSLYCTILSDTGTIIYDSQSGGEDTGKKISEFMRTEDYNKVMAKMEAQEPFTLTFNNAQKQELMRYYYPIKAGNELWWATTVVNEKDINRIILNAVIVLSGLAIGGLVIMAILIITILKNKIKPIEAIVDAAKSIEQGNFDIILETNRQDEIGVLAHTFENTAKALKNVIKDINDVLGQMANKNLNVQTSASYPGQLSTIKIAIDNIISNFNQILKQINEASDQVSVGANEVAQGATEIANGATEQASVIEEFIASTEEISGKITKTIEEVHRTNQMTQLAKEKANEGTAAMQNMLVSMDNITQSSKSISDIIKIIDSIASQTNLLALNAAIESARAGEAGRGFAVVANEIRDLANKSSQTVKEIEQMVKGSLENIEDGQQMANQTAKVLEEIVEEVNQNAQSTEILLENSEQQRVAISELVQGTNHLSEVVETNSSTSQQSAAISEELAAQAENLKKLIGDFELN